MESQSRTHVNILDAQLTVTQPQSEASHAISGKNNTVPVVPEGSGLLAKREIISVARARRNGASGDEGSSFVETVGRTDEYSVEVLSKTQTNKPM